MEKSKKKFKKYLNLKNKQKNLKRYLLMKKMIFLSKLQSEEGLSVPLKSKKEENYENQIYKWSSVYR